MSFQWFAVDEENYGLLSELMMGVWVRYLRMYHLSK